MKAHLPRLARYFAASLIATGTSMVVLGALIAFRITSPAIAGVVATGAGAIPSFELKRAWVWNKRGPREMGREVSVFWAMSIAGLLVSSIAVAFATHRAEAAGLSTLARTLTAQIAYLAASGTLWLGQYVVLDKFLFGARPASVVVTDD